MVRPFYLVLNMCVVVGLVLFVIAFFLRRGDVQSTSSTNQLELISQFSVAFALKYKDRHVS